MLWADRAAWDRAVAALQCEWSEAASSDDERTWAAARPGPRDQAKPEGKQECRAGYLCRLSAVGDIYVICMCCRQEWARREAAQR